MTGPYEAAEREILLDAGSQGERILRVERGWATLVCVHSMCSGGGGGLGECPRRSCMSA